MHFIIHFYYLAVYIMANKLREVLAKSRDVRYGDMVVATEIVKAFIKKYDLIIYGGTAIDYALRLEGKQIYPDDMLTVPDLDFYSPTSIEHSNELALILYKEGMVEARSITAQYIRARKVDIGDNHWIADIAYVPPAIFENLQYLLYEGMRIIHPHFQFIDQHVSLFTPYNNAPREVIFQRWKNDIARYNLLYDTYPLPAFSGVLNMISVTCDMPARGILHGFVAAAAIISEYKRLGGKANLVVDASFELQGGSITFSTPLRQIHIWTTSLRKAIIANNIDESLVDFYEPHFNLVPKRAETKKDGLEYIFISGKNSLATMQNIGDAERGSVRTSSIQSLMRFFLALYLIDRRADNVGLAYYHTLRAIVIAADVAPICDLSIDVYGSKNINLAQEVSLYRIYSEIGITRPLNLAPNYNPAKWEGKLATTEPFDYDSIHFFCEAGRKIARSDNKK